MKQLTLENPKIYPILDLQRPKARQLKEIIKTKLVDILSNNPKQADIIVVGWWDWFFMHKVKEFIDYNKPFIGLNCGTVWFLMNEFEDWKKLKEKPVHIDLITQQAIKIQAKSRNWNIKKDFAINDIVIWNSIFDYIKFDISLFWKPIYWTWFIITTPMWSTAYWKSNGWKIFPLESNIRWLMGLATKDFNYKIIAPQIIIIKPSARSIVNVAIDGKLGLIQDIQELKIYKLGKKYKVWFFDFKWFKKRRFVK